MDNSRFYIQLDLEEAFALMNKLGSTVKGIEARKVIYSGLRQSLETLSSPRGEFPDELLAEIDRLTGGTEWVAPQSPIWTISYAKAILGRFPAQRRRRGFAKIIPLHVVKSDYNKVPMAAEAGL